METWQNASIVTSGYYSSDTVTSHDDYVTVNNNSDVSVSAAVHQINTDEPMTTASSLDDNNFRYNKTIDIGSVVTWSSTTIDDVIHPSTAVVSRGITDDYLESKTTHSSAVNDFIANSYYVIATFLILLTIAVALGLVVRRVFRFAEANRLSLPYNLTGNGESHYTSVDDESQSCGRSWCHSLSMCCYLCCMLCHRCDGSPSSPTGCKYDYIYRPIGGSSGGGSRIEDEYETTFVGVSIPLLHEVSDI